MDNLLRDPVLTRTSNFTVDTRVPFYFIDASAGDITIMLMAPTTMVSASGKQARTQFKRIDTSSNVVTIKTPSGGIENNGDTYTLYPLQSVTMFSNRENYFVQRGRDVSFNDLRDKPELFSGEYDDLNGTPTLFSGNYADLTGKPSLFSGSYLDLTNKPSIPAAQVNSDWNASSGASQILNKPLLFSGAYADLSGKPTTLSSFTNDSGFITLSSLTWANVTGKPVLFSGAYGDLTGKPALFSGVYNDLTGKPALFSGSYSDLTNKPTIPSNTNQLTNGSGFLSNVTGLIVAGSNVTITGAGTSASPYSISSSQMSAASSGNNGYMSAADKTKLDSLPNSVAQLLGTVTVTETAVIALSAGVRKVTVTAPGAVVGGNYLLFPTAATPANYALADVVCVVAGQLQVSVTAPILALGATYSFTCRLVKIL